MKSIFQYILILQLVLILLPDSVIGQTVYLEDDYSDPSLWTQVGTDVQVQNGQVEFVNGSNGGEVRRVYRQMDASLLSTEKWEIKFEFLPTEWGSYFGLPYTAHRLIALTENDGEPGNDCPDIACTGNPPGTQDNITLLVGANNPADGQVFYQIFIKKDGVNYTSDIIDYPALNQKVFLKLSKIYNTITLNVYSDSIYSSNVPNSPVSVMQEELKPLNYIQHSNVAEGGGSRALTGTIDNLLFTKFDAGALWYENDSSIYHLEKNVGIGISTALAKLSIQDSLGVEGNIRAFEFEATPNVWPDYVFDDDYELMPLPDLEKYIKKHRHLPKVPTEKEILRDGNELLKTDVLLLEKIEELMLHLIEIDKKVEKVASQIDQ